MNTVFHVSIYSLTGLAGLILAFAEERFLPSLLTVPLAFLAWLLNEKLRLIRLNVLWSNLSGVAAFIVAANELLGESSETRVLAGAHLLTYLTWIALFQAKRGRQYWWLLALGVMQVAVSSILTEQGMFGVLMAVYVFFGLWTLAVFSVYQAHLGFDQAGIQDSGPPQRADDSSGTKSPRSRDQFRSAIQLDPEERWVNARFVTGVVTTSLLSLLIGLCFFVFIPRLWVSRKPSETINGPQFRLVTGFTNEIQLGEIGQILESNRAVLQVRCHDRERNREITVDELATRLGYSEPLFRGSVMGRYENGRWHVLNESRKGVELNSAHGQQGARYLQRIILHDASTDTLLAMHPILMAEVGPGEKLPVIDMVTSILMRPEAARGQKPYEYSLHTYQPARRRRPSIFEVPTGVVARNAAYQRFLDLPDDLAVIQAEAQQITASVPSDLNAYQRAEWIVREVERDLRDSGKYSYSLDAQVSDPSLDPIEDFLVNRKSGHCEYFASAMTLILRACGVPSRLVSGFKGGERNSYSGAFVVEERHAHAWVEARIGNHWRSLDPTPGAARAASVKEIGEERSVLSELGTLITSLWHQRVVRLSLSEQQRLLYSPLAERLQRATGSPVSRSLWEEAKQFAADPSRWFSSSTFFVIFLLAVVLLIARTCLRRLADADRGLLERILLAVRHWLSQRRERRERSRVDFYEQFVAILAGHGFRRAPAQTPLEFAAKTQKQLDERLQGDNLTDFPDDLVRRFYDVRYGGRPVQPAERQAISHLLSRLEQTLAAETELRGRT